MVMANEIINELPIEVFKGDIIVIDNEREVDVACEYLSQLKVVGFDTESKPSFRKGVKNTLSLIQLSSEDRCYLFRVNLFTNMPKSLINFFSSDSTCKVGLSLKDDFSRIRKFTSKTPSNTIDIQDVITKYDIQDKSLKKIYAILFHKRISKKQQLSNWDAPELTSAQQMYASLDAWACLQIYNKLKSINPEFLK